MRTGGLSLSLSGWRGKVRRQGMAWQGKARQGKTRAGQVRSDSVIGKSGAESRETRQGRRAMMKQEKPAAVGCACACACALHTQYVHGRTSKCTSACGRAGVRGNARDMVEGWLVWPWMGGRMGWMGWFCRGRTEILKVASDGLAVASVCLQVFVTRPIPHRPVASTYLGSHRLFL